MTAHLGSEPLACSRYTSDTEVFTHSCWKFLNDLDARDLLMTLNLESMLQEWSGFSGATKAKVNTELLHFSNRNMSLLVAENHRMIARKGVTNLNLAHQDSFNDPVRRDQFGRESLIRADDIRANHRLFVRGFRWDGDECPVFVLPATTQLQQYSHRLIDVPAKHIDMGDWLEFFGMYLADGCVRQGLNSQGNPRYLVSIKQSEKNEDYILELFQGIGFECRISRNKSGNHNYEVYSKQLWTYLNQFGKSHDKYVPAEFLNLNKAYLRRLWDGYTAGDSHVNEYQLRLGSVSRRLLEGMQQLILRLFGRLHQVRTVTDTYGEFKDNPYVHYRLHFSFNEKNRGARYGVPEAVKYRGDMHSLILDRNKAMLIRHGEFVSWVGN